VRHQDTTERPREITGGEYSEGLELPQPIRDFRWEKKLTNRVREENEDDEIVELEETSQRCQTERLIVSNGQAAVRNGSNT